MSCFISEEARLQRRINRQIEEQLRRDKKEQKKELKLLLLGTGESGKSTFIKQMRIIHGKGYGRQESMNFRSLIFRNIYTAVQTLIEAMQALEIPYEFAELGDSLPELTSVNLDYVESMREGHQELITKLWTDSGVRDCFARRREFQISDSAEYYLSSLVRICASDYCPTQQDILRARFPTTGINEYHFNISGAIFRMVDVGGQRSERKKWIHCFENVASVIFLVAMSEYDQVLVESSKPVNRMKESLFLFQTICQYPWFRNSSIILFLNKKDLLEEKVKTSHLVHYFEDYKGPKQDYLSARAHIAKMYHSMVPERSDHIYTHFTCATDTENIKFVFDVVKNHILQQRIVEVIPGL